MNIEIIQDGRVLRTIRHTGQLFVEAPESGEYELRLTNTHPNRRMAVVSVDGINVIDGTAASTGGAGYVINGWQSVSIKGFLRGSNECARFTFAASAGSYAAQTGRGEKNTGVIGLAVFDERVAPVAFKPQTEIHHHHHYKRGGGPTWDLGRNPERRRCFAAAAQECDSDDVRIISSVAPDLGTAYGRAEAFFTATTSFVRASITPALTTTLRYGVLAKLREWGVPVDTVPASPAPNPFPASTGYAPPPPGWGR